jgi:hypothetical protein
MSKLNCRILFIILILASGRLCDAQKMTAFTNFRIFPSVITQTEPVVCFHPTNKMIMFASSYTINTMSGFKSEGVYISTNGGYNWYGTDTCKGSNIQNHGGDPGVSIDKNGILILTHIGSIISGVYSHYSTDMGSTWSNAYVLTNTQPEDKGSSTTDDTPQSPYYGRTYASWVNFVTPFPLNFSYTTNSGQTWSPSVAINSPPPQRCSGGYIRTGTDGKVYIAWSGVSNTSPFTENFAGLAISSNGGLSWTILQNIYAMNGINGTLVTKGNIRVNGLPRFEIDHSGGPRNGWLYMVTAEKNLSPAGTDPDIILHFSINGGLNWSAGIRVNQDALNNGKIQYCPSITVDSTGAIDILYYDDRHTTSDSAEVMLSRSKDGGNTWTEIVISDHRFKPKPIAGAAASYQGDFISVVSSGNKIYAHWMDDHSGIYQIWSTIIDINTISVRRINTELPGNFELSQNYPNPFNPSTNIRFDIQKTENGYQKTVTKLSVFDISGRLIQTLIKQELQPGTYEVEFDGSGLNSGVYFYKLEYGKQTAVRKMLFVK